MAENTKEIKAPEPGITGRVWSHGNHERQVQIAGLLADKAELHNARLSPAEWQKHVDQYMRSERV